MSDSKDHPEKKHKSHGPPHGGGGHDGEHEGAPEWLISFADNVTLMMGFFVILLAMNMGPKAAVGQEEGDQDGVPAGMLDTAIAIREAFHNPVMVDSNDPREAALVKRLRERQRKGETTDPGPEGDAHDQQAVRQTDYTNIGGVVVFEHGATDIPSAGNATILDLARQLSGTRWIVEIRGHASALETFRDEARGRKLSYDRAFAVATALAGEGIPWRHLRLIAVGDSDPVAPRPSDPAQHAPNSRAEIVITERAVSGDPFAQEPGSPSSSK